MANALEFHPSQHFDVVGLVFAHMPEPNACVSSPRVWSWVKPGGVHVVEGFHKDQLGLGSGGPKQLDMLYDQDTFRRDVEEAFDDATTIWSARCEQILDEGPFHQGFAVTQQVVHLKQHA